MSWKFSFVRLEKRRWQDQNEKPRRVCKKNELYMFRILTLMIIINLEIPPTK